MTSLVADTATDVTISVTPAKTYPA